MFEKTEQFFEENRDRILAFIDENPKFFLEMMAKHPAFNMFLREIPGIQPLNGPKGQVFHLTISD